MFQKWVAAKNFDCLPLSWWKAFLQNHNLHSCVGFFHADFLSSADVHMWEHCCISYLLVFNKSTPKLVT